MLDLEEIFLSAKWFSEHHIGIEINTALAATLDPSYRIGMQISGFKEHNSMRNINVFGGEFAQSESNYVDTFPNMLYYLVSAPGEEEKKYLVIDSLFDEVESISIKVVNRMQQYSEPVQSMTLELDN